MLTVAEADDRLAAVSFPGRIELVPIEHAVGRVLAEPVVADRDGPPYDRVAMDGYAVSSQEMGRWWAVVALQTAGNPPPDRGGSNTAVEVATGAVLPNSCDTVVPYEHIVREAGTVTLAPDQPQPFAGRHVHRQGSDYQQGQVLIPAGVCLKSPHIHSLATVGVDPVPVLGRPVWSLAATGDELVAIDQRPKPWQIRRSNTAAIAGEAGAWGLVPREQALLPDHKDRLAQGLQELLPGLDALVITGGVSAGALDLVPGVLAELGVELLFHKVAQRPGKPLWCGLKSNASGHQTLIFGLPGNPVSSLFAFRRYVLPWLLAAEGRPLAECRVSTSGLEPPPLGQTVFLPWSDTHGVLGWKGSGDFLALAESDGFIEVDDAMSLREPRYHRWGGRP